jgi:hypothetical protein
MRFQPDVVKAARADQPLSKALPIKRLRWTRHIPMAQFHATLA